VVKHERIRIVGIDVIAALLREIGFVAFLVHRVEQFFLLAIEIHLLLILVEFEFGAVHDDAVLGVFQNFEQRFGTRLAGFHAEQQQANFFFQRAGILHVGAVGRM
jgi:hypothetical protein